MACFPLRLSEFPYCPLPAEILQIILGKYLGLLPPIYPKEIEDFLDNHEVPLRDKVEWLVETEDIRYLPTILEKAFVIEEILPLFDSPIICQELRGRPEVYSWANFNSMIKSQSLCRFILEEGWEFLLHDGTDYLFRNCHLSTLWYATILLRSREHYEIIRKYPISHERLSGIVYLFFVSSRNKKTDDEFHVKRQYLKGTVRRCTNEMIDSLLELFQHPREEDEAFFGDVLRFMAETDWTPTVEFAVLASGYPDLLTKSLPSTLQESGKWETEIFSSCPKRNIITPNVRDAIVHLDQIDTLRYFDTLKDAKSRGYINIPSLFLRLCEAGAIRCLFYLVDRYVVVENNMMQFHVEAASSQKPIAYVEDHFCFQTVFHSVISFLKERDLLRFFRFSSIWRNAIETSNTKVLDEVLSDETFHSEMFRAVTLKPDIAEYFYKRGFRMSEKDFPLAIASSRRPLQEVLLEHEPKFLSWLKTSPTYRAIKDLAPSVLKELIRDENIFNEVQEQLSRLPLQHLTWGNRELLMFLWENFPIIRPLAPNFSHGLLHVRELLIQTKEITPNLRVPWCLLEYAVMRDDVESLKFLLEECNPIREFPNRYNITELRKTSSKKNAWKCFYYLLSKAKGLPSTPLHHCILALRDLSVITALLKRGYVPPSRDVISRSRTLRNISRQDFLHNDLIRYLYSVSGVNADILFGRFVCSKEENPIFFSMVNKISLQ